MKNIIESLNAKMFNEKITNLSEYKFEVPIEQIFELPLKPDNCALAFLKENCEKTHKNCETEKFEAPAAKSLFGQKPSFAMLASKKESFLNPFAKKSAEKTETNNENFLKIKNENEKKNSLLKQNEQKTDSPKEESSLEDLHLNEEETQAEQSTTIREPFCKSSRSEVNASFDAAQNFTPNANFLLGNENKNNLLNFKFNKFNNNYNYSSKINNNTNNVMNCKSIENNLIIKNLQSKLNLNDSSNEKNNFLTINKINENSNLKKNSNLPNNPLANVKAAISNPFKEKVKLLFNKRNSNTQSESQLSNPFERFSKNKPENRASLSSSKESTEDDASSIDNNFIVSDKNNKEKNFNLLIKDPFKYNKLLLQGIKIE